MKKILYILPLVLVIFSCKKEEIYPITESTGLTLNITEINTDTPESFKIENNVFSKIPSWHDNSVNGISIERRIQFDVQTPNSDELRIELWFRKIENEELINLSEETITLEDSWRKMKNWDYKENKMELVEFYNNPNTFSGLSVNSLRPSGGSPFLFQVIEAKEIEVDESIVTWVEIEISGELYGTFSPDQGPGLKIDGTFKGVLE